jgi:hypothetical protein
MLGRVFPSVVLALRFHVGITRNMHTYATNQYANRFPIELHASLSNLYIAVALEYVFAAVKLNVNYVGGVFNFLWPERAGPPRASDVICE